MKKRVVSLLMAVFMLFTMLPMPGFAEGGAADAPALDVPAADVPAGDESAADAPAADAPTTAPVGGEPTTAPAADEPAADEPAADAPAADEPAADEPAADAPAADEPAADVPAADESAADAPAADEPAANESAVVEVIVWDKVNEFDIPDVIVTLNRIGEDTPVYTTDELSDENTYVFTDVADGEYEVNVDFSMINTDYAGYITPEVPETVTVEGGVATPEIVELYIDIYSAPGYGQNLLDVPEASDSTPVATVLNLTVNVYDVSNNNEPMSTARVTFSYTDNNGQTENKVTDGENGLVSLNWNKPYTVTLSDIVGYFWPDVNNQSTYVANEHVYIGEFVVYLKKTQVEINVVNDDDEPLSATVQVLYDGRVAQLPGGDMAENDENNGTIEFQGLSTNVKYTLHVPSVPDGYIVPTDTTFEIGLDGTLTSNGTNIEDGVLLVELAKTKVSVSTIDLADGEELEGSTIQIIDKYGKVVDEWVSTEEAHEIEGLKTGEEYTLRVTVASDGYTVPTDTTFKLKADGTIDSTVTTANVEDGVLLVKLTKTKIKVSTVDVADGDELEGSTIQIIDKDGNVVEEWVSTKENHAVEGLKTGEEYTLRVTVASDGYTVPTDTTFTIDEKGKVTSAGTVTEDGVLLVELAKTKIKVSTVDVADGSELEGSHIQIIDKDGNVVEEWDSTEEAHEIEGLKTGEEYTLRVTVASDGFTLTTDTTFTIDEKGKVTSAGTVTDDGVLLVELVKTKVKISAVDAAAGSELEGSHIQIIDSEGNVVKEWDSTEEAHEIEGLNTGEEYALRVTVAPDGYVVPADTTFTIDEKGEVTSSGEVSEDGVLQVQFRTPYVNVVVVDAYDDAALEDAEIQIVDEQSDEVINAEWDPDLEAFTAELDVGRDYSVKVVTAPEGYMLPMTETKFSLDDSGNIIDTDGEEIADRTIRLELEKTCVSAYVVDAADGEPLEGVTVHILDSADEIVWESDASEFTVEGLIAGEEYRAKIAAAPNGYFAGDEYPFSIDENGDIVGGEETLILEVARTEVKVAVQLMAGVEIESDGLNMLVEDENGSVAHKWTVTMSALTHNITGLRVGVEYTMYVENMNASSLGSPKYTFTINEDGSIEYSGVQLDDGTLLVEITNRNTVQFFAPAGTVITIDDNGDHLLEGDERVFSISGKQVTLAPGVIYTVTVTHIPDGYLMEGDTSVFTVQIDEGGNVVAENSTLEDKRLEGDTQAYVALPITKAVVAKIVWDDMDNEIGTRPDGVDVKLYKDEDLVENNDGTTHLTATADDWSVAFKFSDGWAIGSLIVNESLEGYQVESGAAKHYSATITGKNGVFTIIYTLNIEELKQPDGSIRNDDGEYFITDPEGNIVPVKKNDDGSYTDGEGNIWVSDGKGGFERQEIEPTATPAATPTATPATTPSATPGDGSDYDDSTTDETGTAVDGGEALMKLLGVDVLELLYDAEYQPVSYELLWVQLEDEDAEIEAEYEHDAVYVRAMPNENGEAEQRSLIMNGRMLTHLAQQVGIEHLMFENGDSVATQEMADLLGGDLPKLIALALSGVEITDEVLTQDWSMLEDVVLTDEMLTQVQIEMRSVPVEQEDGAIAYEISVWLRWNGRELDISGMLPSLCVNLVVDEAVAEANTDAFAQQYEMIRLDATGAEQVLDAEQTELPAAIAENVICIAESYTVTFSEDGALTPNTAYAANVKLDEYHYCALTAEYAGAGVYMIREAE